MGFFRPVHTSSSERRHILRLSSCNCRGIGARSMTLRSTSPFRTLAALLLLFAVVFGGASDAVACDDVGTSIEQTIQSIDTSPAPKKSSDDAQPHVLCAHGHCHNVSPLDRGVVFVAEQLAADSLHFALPLAALSAAEITSDKEPPRA